MTGFTIAAAPGPHPVLAPLSPAPTGIAADIDARSAAVDAGFAGGEIVLRATDDPTIAALAAALDDLGGRILAMPGVGIPFPVFLALADRTRHVVGVASGDPSPFTALGAFAAIRAWRADLGGVLVGVIGAGRVGGRLAALLAGAGAEVFVADLDPARAAAVATEVGARAVPPEDLLRADVEVLSPNARGTTIAAGAVADLKCALVAGAASGPFGPGAIAALDARGIARVPEEIAGSGWLLALAEERDGAEFDRAAAERRVLTIGEKARCWLSKTSS